MAGNLESLSCISNFGTIDAQDGKILIEVVPNQQIPSIGRENGSFWKSSNLNFFDFAQIFSIYLQDINVTIFIIEV